MDLNEPNRPAKRKRLNFACNYCRLKKVRCDQQYPSCQGCLAAGVECVTTDKRRPGVEVVRKPAGSGQGMTPGPSPSPARQVQLLPAVTPASPDTPGAAVPQHGTASSAAAPEPATNRSPSTATVLNDSGPTDDPPGRFAGRLPMAPRISGGDTLEIMTGWLELAFHRLGIPSSFGICLQLNAKEGSPIPAISLTLPRIPPAAQCREALETYYATVHRLYPILDRPLLDRICEDVIKSCPAGMVHAGRLPELLLFCLAFVLGSTGHPSAESSDLTASYISFCESMLGQVLGWGTLDAVRIIFLLALALRWRDKITSAWPLAGLCASIAQVLGLDRQKPHGRRGSGAVGEETDQERRRVWWCIYSFEKLFAFELGRPSTISDADHDQLEPALEKGTDFFHIITSLARTLSEVSRRSIEARTKEELAGREGLQNAIRFKVATTGELVLLMMQWAESLPKHLRPTSDLLCEPAEFPIAAFISMQHHSAMIMLLRNTFLVSDEAIRDAVEVIAAGKPWDHVTRNGQTIAANSARSIVRILIEGHDRGLRPVLHTITAPLHVLSVLSVHLIRHPTSRLADSDISLIRNAGEFAVERYERKDKRVQGIVQLLETEVIRTVAAAQPKVTARKSIVGPSLRADNSPGRANHTHNDASVALNEGLQGFSHGYGNLPADLADLSTAMAIPMPVPDVAWSPELADQIGWDWGDFSQLFTEPSL